MDGQQFDDLTRAFARGRSRRQVLKGLAGGLVAAVAGSLGRPAAAQPCKNPTSCSPTVACCPGAKCVGGVCQSHKPPKGSCKTDAPCGPGQRCCGGTCTPVDTVVNCGSCGNACAAPPNATASCVGGQCQFTCNQGFTLCNGACVTTCDPATGEVLDPTSCQCACPLGSSLCSGTCQAECAAPKVRNLTTCDCECPATTCSGLKTVDLGTCQCTCPHTAFDCPDPLVFNPTTCACEGCPEGQEFCVGNQSCVGACAGGRTLNQESCACECPSGQEVCSATDACVAGCDPATGEVLDPVTCECGCVTGEELCGDVCVTSCAAPEVLDPSTCSCMCPPEATVNGTCVFACSDPLFCGSTKRPCPASSNCQCVSSAEGTNVCITGEAGFACGPSCTGSAGCGTGEVCVIDSCCPGACELNQDGTLKRCGAGDPCGAGFTCNAAGFCCGGTGVGSCQRLCAG